MGGVSGAEGSRLHSEDRGPLHVDGGGVQNETPRFELGLVAQGDVRGDEAPGANVARPDACEWCWHQAEARSAVRARCTRAIPRASRWFCFLFSLRMDRLARKKD